MSFWSLLTTSWARSQRYTRLTSQRRRRNRSWRKFSTCRRQIPLSLEGLEDRTLLAGSLTIGDLSISEGDAGTSTFEFTVDRTGSSSGVVTVDFETGGGNATPVQTFFNEQTLSSTADRAEAVSSADVDGDGDSDILSASYFSDTIHWYENLGGGVFTTHTVTTSANGAEDVTSGDFDGDGDTDILTASREDNTIAWYENDGNENFTFHAIDTAVAGEKRVAVADVDGDGDLDAMASSDFDHTVFWYENDGNGNFTTRVVTNIANQVNAFEATDLDGDGDLDVLTSNPGDNTVSWFENDGNEIFTRHVIFEAPSEATPTAVSSADFDDDGDLDVVAVYDGDYTITWFENDGNENFTYQEIRTTPDGVRDVRTADMDGDGDVDVVVSVGGDDAGIQWHENLGRNFWTLHTVTAGKLVAPTLFTDDLDGDGNLEILSASTVEDTITYYENQKLGDYFATSGSLMFADGVTQQTITVIVNGDVAHEEDEYLLVSLSNTVGGSVDDGQARGTILNDDALPGATVSIGDAVVTEGDLLSKTVEFTVTRSGDTSGETTVDFTTADGTALGIVDVSTEFSRFEEHLIDNTADGARNVQVADVDGDGDLDMVSSSRDDNTLAWYENDGNENYTFHEIVILGDVYGVATADIDGDGDVDIIATSYARNEVNIYENDGSENFTERTISGAGELDRPSDVKVVDLDADGDLDIVVAVNFDSILVWYESDGAGGFTYHTVSTGAARADDFEVIDLDQDGDLDFVGSMLSPRQVLWFENDGSENFTKHIIADEVWTIESVWAADMDGDGDLDVLTGSTYAIDWYENDGNENFTHYVIDDFAGSSNSVATADIDGDGDLDVVAATAGLSQIAWYENLGYGNYRFHYISTVSVGVEKIILTDIDGDGDVDVAAASFGDDSIRWFENNGGVIGERGDYQTTSGSLTFLAGETEKTITVQVAGDFDDEANETFFVNLSNVAGGAIADGQGEGRILNDDVRELFISDVTYVEGNLGTKNFNFVATRPGSTSERLRVRFEFEAGSADGGPNADFGPTAQWGWGGYLIFEPGVSEIIIAVPVYSDLVVEPDESFGVFFFEINDTLITDDWAVGTIINDDVPPPAQPTISVSDVTVTEGAGLGGGEFMDAFVSSGEGGVNIPRSLTFGPDGNLYVGSRAGVFRYDGQTGEPLSTPLNHGAEFILDNDGGVLTFDAVVFGPDDNVYTLGDGVHRFNPVDGTFVDTFIPADQVLNARTMFFGEDGLLYVLIGQSSLPDQVLRFDAVTGEFVDIFVGDDPLTGGVDETGGLTGAQDMVFGPDGDLYVVNDTRNDSTAGVLRYDGDSGAFLGRFAAIPGPRIPSGLAFSADGSLLFVTNRAGSSVMQIDATTGELIGDFVAPGAGGLDDISDIQVNADGNLYVISARLNEVLRFAGPVGSLASFTVTRSGDASGEATVDFTTVDSSAAGLVDRVFVNPLANNAEAGRDYVATDGTITFAAGETQRTIVVQILGDTLFEDDETFSVVLNNASGAVIEDGEGVATIQNDDSPLPDLVPDVIDGVWDSPIVVSTVTGTNTDALAYNATDNLFVDLGVANLGIAEAGPFSVTLRIDGSTITTLTRSTPLGVNEFALDFQDIAIGTLSNGIHTIELIIDSTGSVDEGLSGGEGNNIFYKVINVGAAGYADIGPGLAAGWDNPIVISKESGTNTSTPLLLTTDDIYVDLGSGNFGSIPSGSYSVTLTLDGVEVTTLQQTGTLGVFNFAGFEDIFLGQLSAGEHTLEMTVDSGDDVDEGPGGEDNNVFSRTFTVFEPSTLSGIKWNDTNGDGVQDAVEDPLAGFVVYLDINGNGVRDVADEPFTTTNAQGEYEFTNLLPGTYTVAVEYPDGTDRVQTFPGSQDETQAGFDIDFRFLTAALTPEQEQLFLDAAAVWESIIVGDLSDMVSPDGFFVDDFLMDVYTVDIDGVGNTLGQASPYFGSPPWYHEGTLLPLRGYVELDVNDIDHPELFGTILHEIGHALGLGVLWDTNGLRANVGTSDPRYIGAEAVQQYADIFNISASSIPLENVGGPGSVGSHWRETVFDNELMTSISDPNAMISLVTVGALADLGYEVDYNQAQSYRPPGTSLPFVTVDTVISTIDEEGATAGAFTFTRTDTTSGVLEVHYSIGGTATAGSDFEVLPGIATILDGESSVTVDLTPLTDGSAEGLETIVITVESGSGYTVGAPRYATVTIEDDELVEPVIPLSYTVTVHPGETIGNLDFGSRIPTSVPPFIEAQIDDVTVAEDAASTIVDLFAAFGDTEDLDTELSFRVSDNTNPALFASLNIAAGMLTLDYAANTNGTATLTIEAMDTTGQTVTQSFDVTITAVNDDPVIVSTSVDAVEDTILDVDLRTLVDDVETADNDLTFTVSSAVNGSVELLADGYTARFTPAADYFGAAAFDFEVTDTGDGADSAITLGPITVNVDITSVNDSPSFTLAGDQVVDEDSGGRINYLFAKDIAAGPVDESGQTLTFLVSTDNDALFADGPTIDATTGALSFAVADDAAGTAVVTVRLMDNGGTANGGVNISEAQTFSIIVNNINDAPVLTVPGQLFVDEDTQLDIDGVSVTDIDSATVALELSSTFGNITLGNTSGLTVSGNGTDDIMVEGAVADINAALATLSYRSNPGSSGMEGILIRVTDSEAATDFTYILINVIPAAFVPEVTLDASSNIIEEAGGTVTITATLSGITTEDVTVFLGFGGTADDFIEGGSLLVANGATNSILRYDATTGAFIDEYFTGAAGDMIIGPDGDFYVANVATDSILRYDGATGALLGTFASGGGLNDPRGLVFGPDGNLYVTSNQTDSVLRYNGTTGAFIDQFVLPNTEDLGNPVGLAFGADGNLYVSNHGRGGSRGPYNVLVFNGTTGAYIKELFGDGAGGLDEPTGLAFGPDGNLYLIDEPDDEILRYNGTTGAFLGSFASGGGLDAPTDFTFGPDGNLYVSSASGAILKYDGTTGDFLGTMSSGGGLVDPLGLLFVASAGDYRLSDHSIVIEAGSLSGSITITGVADELDEGSETVIVDITDVTGGVELGQQQVTTTIVEEIGSNQPPTTTGIADVTVDEDAAATQIDLFAAFDDAEDADQQLTYEVVGNSNAALFTAVSISPATGILTLDYAPNLHGVADITIRATDLGGEFVETTFAVTVNAVNDAPVFSGLTLNLDEDERIDFFLTSYVTDVETLGQDLVFDIIGVDHIVLNFASNGDATVLPIPNYNGPASFEFTVMDTGDGTDAPITVGPFIVNINYAPVNDAPVAETTTLNTDQETAVDINLRTLVDDVETPDGALTFSVSNAVNGTVELLANGYTARFTPADGYNGPASFDYHVTDTGDNGDAPLTSGPVTIDVNVADVNQAPVAVGTTLNTNEDTAVEIDLRTLVDDAETADDDLVFSVSGAVNGTVELLSDGYTARYTPGADYNGAASFLYDVTDTGDGIHSPITVGPIVINVNVAAVNDAPIYIFTTLNLNEDERFDFSLTSLISDVETTGQDLVFDITGVDNIILNWNSLHFATVIPVPDYNGFGNFEFTVTDTGDGVDGPVTVGPFIVNIIIAPVNDAPVVETTTLNTTEGTGVSIDLRSLVDDVETPDIDLAFSVSNAVNGTVELLANGYTAVFTPADGYNGPAAFDYEVTDTGDNGDAPISSGPVTIDVNVFAVNQAPVAVGITLNTNEDTAVDIDLRTLVEDDETADDDLVFSVSGAVNGTVELLADGYTARFTPGADYFGPASFQYDVTDTGDSGAAPITVGPIVNNVVIAAENDTPVIELVLSNFDVNEDAPPTVLDLFTYFSDVEDPDEDLVFEVTGNTDATLFENVSIDEVTGELTLEYAANAAGLTVITVRATDTGGLFVEQTFRIIVEDVNDPPVASTTTLNTTEDTAVDIDLRTLVEDVETEDDNFTFAVSNPVNGTVELLPDGYTARFTPDEDFSGVAAFDYHVTDDGIRGDNPFVTVGPVTITVNVGGDNDQPFVETPIGDVAVIEDAPSSVIDLFAAFEDLEDADSELDLEITANSNASLFASVMIDPTTGQLTLDYAPDANGSSTITVQATDTGGLSVSQTFIVDVAAVNDDPVATGTTLATDEDTPVEIDLRTLVDDIETADDDLVFSVSGAVNGTVELLANGYTARFTPGANYNGAASFNYDVTDTGDGSDAAITSAPQTIDVNVAAVNDDPVATGTTLNTDEDTPVEIDLRTLVDDVETADDDLVFNVSGAVNGSVELLADGHTARFTPGANYNGPASFVYDVTDTGDGSAAAITSAPQVIDVTVAAVNDAPVAGTTTLNTNEDTAVEIDLRTLVDDVETTGDDLLFSVSGAVNGTVELLADGYTARFTPGADYNGPASFDYDVTDTGDGADTPLTSDPVTINVTVSATNDTPVATGTTLNTVEDTPVEIDLRTLVDDVETADDDLVFSVSGATNGSVELLTDGFTARFTPVANYNGPASFVYDVTDTGDGADPAIIVGPFAIDITVAAVNDDPVATATTLNTDEDSPVEIDLRTLVDDVETADDDLVFNVSGAVNGSVELLADGYTARFTPGANYNGPASFVYDVMDTGDGGAAAITSGPLTIDVNVAAVNDDPVANPTTLATDEDTPVEIDLRTLVEDVETADDDLVFSVSGAVNGTVELLADGYTARFTPGANYNGPASFDYDVTDAGDGSDAPITVSPVTIDVIVTAVNDDPVATGTTIATDEDTPVEIDLRTLVADLETADDDLVFNVSGGVNGTVELLADGYTARFTPGANYNGAALFVYDVTDMGDGGDPGIIVGPLTIDINVAAVNDDPVATAATLATDEDTPVEIDLRTLVGDVETADDDLLFSVSGAVNGTVELLADGYTARFTPGADYNGPASFVYDVTDTGDGSAAAILVGPITIDVTVGGDNDQPFVETPIDDVAVLEDAPSSLIDLFAAFDDLEDADSDLDFEITANSNASLFVSAMINPTTGQLTLDYAPNANGTSTITVQATDTGGLSISQTFVVDVAAVNDVPQGDVTTFNILEDTPLEVDLRTFVSDVETAAEDLIFNVSGAVNGTVELLADGHTARFTPTANYNGPASFNYDVTDTGDGSAAAITTGPLTMTVNVAAVNDDPVATGTTLNTDEDTPVEIDLRTLVDDVETADDDLVFSVSGAVNGTVELLANGYTARFTPGANYNGPAAFNYDVTDTGDGSAAAITSAPQTVDVNVAAVNDDPVAGTTTLNTDEDTPVEIDLRTLVDDVETADDDLVFNVSGAVNGSVELLADGYTARFTPGANYNGSASFVYDVTDTGDGADPAITVGPLAIDINVAAVNDDPTATGTTLATDEDTPVEIDLRTLVDDVETVDDDLVFSVSGAVNGIVELLADGYTARFTPGANYNGAASFEYDVTDTGDGSAAAITSVPQTVDIDVAAVNDDPTAGTTTLNTDEDTPVEIDLRTLVDDVETADDELVFNVSGAVNGTVELLADGYTARFTPGANYNGAASFVYDVTDSGDGDDPGIIAGPIAIDINVAAVNDAPVADSTTLSTGEDTPVEIDLRTLVSDVETSDDDLTFSVSDAENGSVELLVDGYTARFTPGADYNGPASFAYRVTDTGDGGDDPITVGPVTIDVTVGGDNDQPFVETPIGDVAVIEDAPSSVVDLFAAFEDLEDADSELDFEITANSNASLFASVMIDPTTGQLTLDYAPNANGSSTITVQATDTGGLSVSQTFNVDVAAVNDDPVATGTTLETDEDTPVEIDLRTLVDDIETADDDLVFSVSGAVNGTVELLANGYTARFTPGANYNGAASFAYDVTDTGDGSAAAITSDPQIIDVNVAAVNDDPVATGTTLTTDEDTPVEIDLRTLVDDVETADDDLVFNVSGAVNGSVELLADGHTARFTPGADYNGPASFVYDVTDTGDGVDPAIIVGPFAIDITVAAVNDAPLASGTTLNTDEDTAVEIDLRTLVDDVETADDDLVFNVSGAVNGTVELLADGHTARFTPGANYNGPASFVYDVTDTGDGSAAAVTSAPQVIEINVAAVNDAPVAGTTTLNTNEDTAVEIDLRTLVDDVETAGDDLLFSVSGAVNGTVELLADGYTARFTPDADGPASFDYDVTDTGDGSDAAITSGPVTIDVNVAAVNEFTIIDVSVNDGEENRSNVRHITVTFSDDTNIGELIASGQIVDIIQIYGLTNSPSTEVVLSADRFVWDDATNSVTVDLTVDGFGGSGQTLLSNDNYALRIQTGEILNPQLVDAVLQDTDGVDDGIYDYRFHRLEGDIDGDRSVGFSDVMKLTSNFGQFNTDADTTGDGQVNILDFWSVYGNVGSSLPDDIFLESEQF
ncbi:Calx-beta domain protein [Symmachiella dynata]|uniref:Ig-like domain-containing protein n=1 Tax=Symmachiella dynata TaxID=2527995 RepID=UPI001189A3D5|nr:Ig-like domain-containing protein [Symmachiella dynata]QDT51611.1 Calx-beta domain protein [Symmachiella dynata]